MSLPHTAEVLIVGGGPTGLVLALALHKYGCPDVVVVDGALQGENTSRAVVLHAATVEALDSIDCADILVKEGKKVPSTKLWTYKGESPIELASFSALSKYTKYPFILTQPQHVTEKVIEAVARERGVIVHRPHKVVGISPDQDDTTLTNVVFEDGHIIRARCVVGADGARSTVRRLMNIGWASPLKEESPNGKEPSLPSNMVIADITLSAPPPGFETDLNLVVSQETDFLMFVALPGVPYPEITTDTVYRIACTIPTHMGVPPSSPDTEYVQKLMDAWGPTTVLPDGSPRVVVTQAVWSSRFRTHSSIADTPFKHVSDGGSPVFLVGDAAHIHPPTGGQGMNLGIRDGIRLAPVLTEYVRSASSGVPKPRDALESPLKAWAKERHERALTVIALAHEVKVGLERWPNRRMYLLGVIPYNLGWLRNKLLRFLTSFRWFRANNALRITGLKNP